MAQHSEHFTKKASLSPVSHVHDSRPQSLAARSSIRRSKSFKDSCALVGLLSAFIILQALSPLRTAVQIGADEGVELAKVTLCLHGHMLYSEIWNDQPPLHTFLITKVERHLGASVLWPRLVTVGFAIVLLSSVFLITLRCCGLTVATVSTGLVIASPGFIELSASCMLEIPALATAMAALCLLWLGPQTRWCVREVSAGILLAAAVQMKLVPLYLLPMAAVILWLRHSNSESPAKNTIFALFVLGISLILGFATIDLLIERGAFLANFQEAWASHFGRAKSFEYGSADDHPFGWNVLARNWDTTVPALVGIFFLTLQARTERTAMLPLAWLALSFLVFTVHRPWWPYYYIHTAIPLCWCAALGIQNLLERGSASWKRYAFALLALYALCALSWITARIYLQVSGIWKSPQTYNTLVLEQIERFKPFTHWIYADKSVYSFYSGIPLPPHLAVLVAKRFWAGEMTNRRLVEEMIATKPELIVLTNDGREVQFQDLLQTEYRLVYEDGADRLFAHQSIAKKAPP